MKRWRTSLRVFMVLFAIMVVLLIATPLLAANDEASRAVSTSSNILSLLRRHGQPVIPMDDVLQTLSANAIEPISVDLEGIHITINELIYDGIWLYTAAKISPIDSHSILVMPGSAIVSDLVKGGNNENIRDDHRSFIDAAREDRKRLLAVYVYPREFDSLEWYFTDHFQQADDVSVFMSGAKINFGNETPIITWTIQVYEINLDTREYKLLAAVESNPQEVTQLCELEYQDYQLINQNNEPCAQISFVMSIFAAYATIKWHNGKDPNGNLFTLYNEKGIKIEHGMASDTNAFSLSDFPAYIAVETEDDGYIRYLLVKVAN